MSGAGDADGAGRQRRLSSPPRARLPPLLHASVLDSSDDSARSASRDYRSQQAKRRRRARAEAAAQRERGRPSVSESADTHRSRLGPADSVAGDSSSRFRDTLTSPDPDTTEAGELSIASQLQHLADDITASEAGGQPRRRSLSADRLTPPPLTRLYVEKGNRFQLSRRQPGARADAASHADKKSQACAVDLAVQTQRVFGPLGRLCAGLFAGLAVGHSMFVIALATTTGGGGDAVRDEHTATLDLVRHYSPLALPFKAAFYTLSVVCCVATLDRYDVSRLTAAQLRRALTLQDGTIAVLLYLATLGVTCCQAPSDDRMHLFGKNGTLAGVWGGAAEAGRDCHRLLALSATRAALAALAWTLLVGNPAMDRVLAYLRQLPTKSTPAKPDQVPNTLA